MQMIPSLWQKVKKNERASDERKRGERKSWLKTQHSENYWSHHFMADRWGNSGNSDRLFFCAPKLLQMVTAALKLKDAYSLEEKL